ncbi:MAG: proline--tRNA ligase [Armatimonadota bacterium]
MRASQLFFPTLREVPAEAEMISHKLLLRAGFIRKVAAGIYNYLPLGYKTLRKIENILREEMDNHGGQEILMPAIVPANLYQETGRWDLDVLFRLKDRNNRDYSIGFTHEEIVTDIVRRDVKSYNQLPLNLYQIQTKGRDEARPRGGVVRGREFIMLDSYSFDRTPEDLDSSYKAMYSAFSRAFARCGMDALVVDADSGAIGGKASQEYMVITDAGEDMVLVCDKCGYAANMEKCEIGEDTLLENIEEMKDLQLVDTPNAKTIEQVSKMLNVTPDKLVKTLIYKADDTIIAALIRGDRELNEAKLSRALDIKGLEMADPETIVKLTGADVGFAGPIGLDGAKIVADNEVKKLCNVVVGGNKTDAHYINACIDRDFKIDEYADIRNACKGDRCPECDTGVFDLVRGIEIGHIFKLGKIYSEGMDASFLDDDGKEKNYYMGCYGIGVSRILAVIPEVSHDKDGIIWPISVAPFEVHIVLVNPDDEKQCEVATRVYEEMKFAKVDVLIDDRNERPGVKFKDADLIGSPIQVVCGRLASEGKVELKIRATGEKSEVSIDDLSEKILKIRDAMYNDLEVKAQAASKISNSN